MFDAPQIQSMIARIIKDGDAAQLTRLPIGAKVRKRVQTLDVFQVQYLSKTWSEAKTRSLDLKTRHLRPIHTVIAHDQGWMRVTDGHTEFLTAPEAWEIAD